MTWFTGFVLVGSIVIPLFALGGITAACGWLLDQHVQQRRNRWLLQIGVGVGLFVAAWVWAENWIAYMPYFLANLPWH